MTDRDVIEARLCAYISDDLLGGMAVAPEDELLLSDLLDSLSVVRLVAFMEESYGISVPPEDVVLETMQSVRAMTSYLITAHEVAA